MELPQPFRLSLSLEDRERLPVLGAGDRSETSVMADASMSTLWSLLLKLEEEKDMVDKVSYIEGLAARIDSEKWRELTIEDTTTRAAKFKRRKKTKNIWNSRSLYQAVLTAYGGSDWLLETTRSSSS
jgi:hypothetical protein